MADTKSSKSTLADVAILSLADFERIKKNSVNHTKEELRNLKQIQEEQKKQIDANSQARKERIKEIDKTRTDRFQMSDIDRENIEKNKIIAALAKQKTDEEEDCVKEMNKLILYSKVASTREKQLNEQKRIYNEYKKQDAKMDLMMELERLKELQFQEETTKIRREQQRQGALIIVDQIKERDYERIRQKEVLEKERIMMVKQIQELEEEEKRNAEMKKIQADKLAKEVEESNKRAIELKERKKLEDKELELKVIQYNLEKAKKEEEDQLEKKRVREEKEKETQKLREKQERAQDKQAELDAIRAKRAYEETERQAREKEKNEIIVRNQKVVMMLEANERQKYDKELKLAEQAKFEEEEYQKIVQNQLKNLELDKKKEEERKKMRYDHNFELR
jgi:hypothetical protein